MNETPFTKTFKLKSHAQAWARKIEIEIEKGLLLTGPRRRYGRGNKYVGEHKDSKFHGEGTTTFASGSKYVGEWRVDKYHGQGTFTHAKSGRVKKGIWKED